MNTKHHTHISRTVSIICLFAFVFTSAYGQNQDSTSLDLEGVEVVKKFKTNLKNESAIAFELPETPAGEDVFSKGFSYVSNPPKALEVSIPEPQIRTLAFVEEKERSESNNGLLKLGYGNLKSPEVEGHYHYFIENWFEFGLKGNYYTAEGNENPLQKLNQTAAGAYGAYFLNEVTKIKVNFDGAWNKNYLYHPEYIPTQEYDEFDFERKRNAQKIALSIHHSPFSKAKTILNTEFFVDRFESPDSLKSEVLFGTSNHWGKRFGKDAKTGIYADFTYEIYSNEISDDFDKTRLVLRPFLIHEENNIHVKLGFHYDNINTIWPIANLSYHLENLPLSFSLSADAKSEFNSLQKIYKENEFWSSNFDSLSQYATKELSLSSTYQTADFSAQIKVNRIDHDNFLFYFGSANQFTHTANELEEFGVSLNLKYSLNDWLLAKAQVEKKFLDWDQDFEPQYLSDLLASIELSQNIIGNKLRLRQGFYFANQRPFISLNSSGDQELSSILDLNLGIDFAISDMFNVYGSFNNLLDNRYSLWDGYENFGRNIHGGLKLVF